MGLVVFTHSLSTMMVFDKGARGFLGGQLAIYGLTVTEKYEQGGKAATDDYLRRLERNTRMRVHLFDEEGNQLAGREISPELEEMARLSIAEGRDNFSQKARTDFLTRWIQSESGNRYLIASESGRPPWLRLPFWPGVWWAQLLAVILTTGALCYLLARYLSSPVVKLRAATQQLAAGDLSARVGAANNKRRDELADLGRDFDIMAERIESLMVSQQRLLHDISHELRSPLARLKIALELARQGDPADVGWALDRIDREGDRLDDLINQLLTLARLESVSPVAKTDPVDLKRLVSEIVMDADFEARNNNREVKIVTAEDCLIDGNKQLLRSAIENVIRNAVTYTADGTDVEVRLQCEVKAENSQAVISVLDQGEGVPQAALEKIFLPFYRVTDARDRQSGGIGLGLSISQRAVKIHGGTITASNAEAGGLLVQLRFPIANRNVSPNARKEILPANSVVSSR